MVTLRGKIIGAILVAALSAFAATNYAATLEEIVVTATKRATSLQDVAISVQAVTGETIADFGLTNFDDISAPSFKAPRGGMGDQIFMRGIGSGTNQGFEQSVPLFMDGVYFGRGRGVRAGFVDLQQIEIVKGPQPTYMGKNAIGGAVVLNWAKPTEEFEGYIDSMYEFEHDELAVTGVVSGPFSDTVRGRLALRYRDVSEGWVENRFNGDLDPQTENTTFRGILEWDINDNLLATFAGWYSKDEDSGRNQENAFCTSAGLFGMNVDPNDDCTVDGVRSAFNQTVFPIQGYLTDGTPESFVALPSDQAASSGPGSGFNELELMGTYARFELNLSEDILLVAQTSYYEFDNKFWADADQTPADVLLANFNEYFDQISQELRVQSSGDGALSWMIGAYYDSNELEFFNWARINAGMAPNTQLRNITEEADSWAVFAEAEYRFNDQFSLNLGARYTEVEKDYNFAGCRGQLVTAENPVIDCTQVTFPFAVVTDSSTFDMFQPSVTFNWRPNENILTFVSWKQGFKAGGYDFGGNPGSAIELLDFEQEEVDAWEVGLKSTLLDGAATFNVVYFNAEYTDLQVTAFDPALNGGVGASVTGNAATATSEGVEIEFSWAATENLTLNANTAFLTAEYDSYPGAPCAVTAGPSTGFPECDLTTANGRLQDFSGQPTIYAPDWSAQLSATWAQPIGNNLELTVRADLFATDEFYTAADLDPASVVDSYEKFDLRVGIGSQAGDWEVALVGKNLGDEFVCGWIGDVPGSFQRTNATTGEGVGAHACILERTRTVTLQAQYRF